MKTRVDGQRHIVDRLLGQGPTRRARFDLLVFWGRYPGGWSTRAAISPRTRLPKQDIDRALAELVDEGIVDVHGGAPRPYYGLTTAPEILAAVKNLGLLTPRERQALLGTTPGPSANGQGHGDRFSRAEMAQS